MFRKDISIIYFTAEHNIRDFKGRQINRRAFAAAERSLFDEKVGFIVGIYVPEKTINEKLLLNFHSTGFISMDEQGEEVKNSLL